MARFQNDILNILKQAGSQLSDDIKEEMKQQGHYNTGRLFNSVTPTVYQSGDTLDLDITMSEYHVYLEHGVRSNRIPFGGKSRGAKTSKYIQGLKDYFESKGLSEKEALSAAFATAHAHKREGMPTSGSYRFSHNSRRLRFIDESTKANVEIDNIGTKIQDRTEYEGNAVLDTFENKIK